MQERIFQGFGILRRENMKISDGGDIGMKLSEVVYIGTQGD